MNRYNLEFRMHRAVRGLLITVLAPLALLVYAVLLVVSLRTQVRVIPVNVSRFGHLAIDVEYVLSESESQKGSRKLLIFYPWRIDLPVANRALLRMWKREGVWLPSWLGKSICNFDQILFKVPRLLYLLPKEMASQKIFNWGTDPYGVTAQGAGHLRFRDSESRRSISTLLTLGVNLDKPIVTLHVRDNSYIDLHSGRTWRESQNWRNLDIKLFEPAALLLAENGYQVVRMGAKAGQPLSVADGDNIFDYAYSGPRDELLDVFVPTINRFMISTGSGFDSLTQVFRKPLFNVGLMAPNQMFLHRRVISIFQRLSSAALGRTLTLRESLELIKVDNERLRELQLTVVPNSSEEIRELVLEAVQRDRGEWRPTAEDLRLQQRLLSLLPSAYRQFPIRGGVGAHFLRTHPEWLA